MVNSKHRIVLGLLVLVLFSFSTFGQELKKNTIKQSLSSFAYSTTFELSPKWNLNTEFQERIFLDPVRQSQIFARSQVNFTPLKDISLVFSSPLLRRICPFVTFIVFNLMFLFRYCKMAYTL